MSRSATLHPLQIVAWPCKVAISERGPFAWTLYQTLHDVGNLWSVKEVESKRTNKLRSMDPQGTSVSKLQPSRDVATYWLNRPQGRTTKARPGRRRIPWYFSRSLAHTHADIDPTMPNMCTGAFYVLQRLNKSCAIYAIYTVVRGGCQSFRLVKIN